MITSNTLTRFEQNHSSRKINYKKHAKENEVKKTISYKNKPNLNPNPNLCVCFRNWDDLF